MIEECAACRAVSLAGLLCAPASTHGGALVVAHHLHARGSLAARVRERADGRLAKKLPHLRVECTQRRQRGLTRGPSKCYYLTLISSVFTAERRRPWAILWPCQYQTCPMMATRGCCCCHGPQC